MKRTLLILLTCLIFISLAETNLNHIAPRELTFRQLAVSDHLQSAFDCVPDYDLPIICAIAKVESGYRVNAISNKGCLGIMQVNPRYFPEIVKIWRNPEQNVKTGYGIYLDNLEASGSVFDALCRYNGDRSGWYAQTVINEINKAR